MDEMNIMDFIRNIIESASKAIGEPDGENGDKLSFGDNCGDKDEDWFEDEDDFEDEDGFEDECDCGEKCGCDDCQCGDVEAHDTHHESKYPIEPILSRNLFGVFMHNLLEHIKFDEMLYKTSSGMIDLRNSCYYETDMAQMLKFIMDDEDGCINRFIASNKKRLKDGDNISDDKTVDALYTVLLYAYRQRRLDEMKGVRDAK